MDKTIAKLAIQVSTYYENAYEIASNNTEVAKLLGQVGY